MAAEKHPPNSSFKPRRLKESIHPDDTGLLNKLFWTKTHRTVDEFLFS